MRRGHASGGDAARLKQDEAFALSPRLVEKRERRARRLAGAGGATSTALECSASAVRSGPSTSSIGSGAAVMRASYATLADEGKDQNSCHSSVSPESKAQPVSYTRHQPARQRCLQTAGR